MCSSDLCPIPQASAAIPDGMAALGTRLFASVSGTGVFVSLDAGQTWSATGAGLPPAPQFMDLMAADNKVFCLLADGSLYASSNLGAVWSLADRDLAAGVHISSIQSTGASFLAASFDGVFRSETGQTWVRSDTGLRAGSLDGGIRAVGRSLYCVTFGGVWEIGRAHV